MPKRKSNQLDATAQDAPLRRSTRQRTSSATAATTTTTTTTTAKEAATGKTAGRTSVKNKNSQDSESTPHKGGAAATDAAEEEGEEDDEKKEGGKKTSPAAKPKSNPKSKTKTKPKPKAKAESEETSDGVSGTGRQYWLLKAEPDSRFENGVDVKFSIDDLASRTEPEPWDGIRNYVARNNLRAMKKGDFAFFYHSNCKEPGIVGTMEIVQEHSPDLSAHDPKAPYYDPKSSPSEPKWSVVHVKFRSKFDVPIGLKELRTMGGPGKSLENMQMLKQSRLSVSKVSEAEWEYLVGIAEEKAKDV